MLACDSICSGDAESTFVMSRRLCSGGGLCKGNSDSTSDGRRENLVMSLADAESL